MRWFTRIVVTSILSLGIAFSLSLLPLLDDKGERKEDLTVFQNTKLWQISDDNLVDYLLQLPLEMHIGKVDWGNSILTIDLSIQQEGTPDTILMDLYKLTYYGLVGTTNVKQVLVRVREFEHENSVRGGGLMLAMDARRGDVSLEGIRKLQKEQLSVYRFLNEYFQLTFTRAWEERYPFSKDGFQ